MRKKSPVQVTLWVVMPALILLSHFIHPGRSTATQVIQLDKLRSLVRVARDSNYIPHIFAESDHDAFFMLGYIHAQDRFFQMDVRRRAFSGQLAELLGRTELNTDMRLRTYGIRRAAEASMQAYSPEVLATINAYAGGVNAYLAEVRKNPTLLPPEYSDLELTLASIPEWTPLDTVTIAKAFTFQFSFNLSDITLTRTLAAYEQGGAKRGFNGRRLFFEDLFRSAPFDISVSNSVDDSSRFFLNSNKSGRLNTKTEPGLGRVFTEDHLSPYTGSFAVGDSARRPQKSASWPATDLPSVTDHITSKLAEKYLEEIKEAPFLQQFLNRDDSNFGSNFWVVSGKHTVSGYPMLANDPHLGLEMATVFHEAHLIVENDPKLGRMNVSGVSIAGVPGIVLGCNDRLCWGATANPMDVTDVYQEELVEDTNKNLSATVFEGKQEPLTVIEQKYKVNSLDDGKLDNVTPVDVPNKFTWIVPRRNNGPLIQHERQGGGLFGLSVQYAGSGATRELEAISRWGRAKNIEDFKRSLQFYDVGSQNWVIADIGGNIAFFTSGKAPLREDLQNLGRPDGDIPPFLIRDGTHKLKHEWLPVETPQPGQPIGFQTLPFDEMPHVINPKQGFIVNANNDPVGTTTDNDPLNQYRKGGGVYYLNSSYPLVVRAKRIVQLLQEKLSRREKLSLDDMMRFQADNRLPEAETLMPYILKAFDNARLQNAHPALAALAANPGVAEAVSRFRQWDFSSPTGISHNKQASNGLENQSDLSVKEIQSSICATIYAVWRSRILNNTIDATLRRLELGNIPTGIAALRHLLDRFETNHGKGASGVNFFYTNEATSPEIARDTIILKSLQDALNDLAGDSFAPAFRKSANQNDYRWGLLHRIRFNHRLGKRFNIPEAAGFTHVSPELPGIAMPGGFESLEGVGHSPRVTSINSFMTSSGQACRFVSVMSPRGPNAFMIIPGGESGDVRNQFYANMLKSWLTHQYHPMRLTRKQANDNVLSMQVFQPTRGRIPKK